MCPFVPIDVTIVAVTALPDENASAYFPFSSDAIDSSNALRFGLFDREYSYP